MSELAAILLAGGRGARMGGVDKPLLDVGGRSLLAIALDAAEQTGCAPIVVAGPPRAALADRAIWVREEPAHGGPAAAIVRALAAFGEPVPPLTVVLACDLPEAEAALARLRAEAGSLPDGVDGRCLELDGRAQWLCGLYRTDALRSGAAALPGRGDGASVRSLLGGLRIETVAAGGALASDVDTWHDLGEARARASGARDTEEAP